MTETEKPRVVIVVGWSGDFSIYSDEGVEVYAVVDEVRHNRVTRLEGSGIPDGLLDGPSGDYRKVRAAQVRRNASALHSLGERHLWPVEND